MSEERRARSGEDEAFRWPVQQDGHKYDPARAKKLLAEAGYRGQPIKITTNSRFAVMNDVEVLR